MKCTDKKSRSDKYQDQKCNLVALVDWRIIKLHKRQPGERGRYRYKTYFEIEKRECEPRNPSGEPCSANELKSTPVLHRVSHCLFPYLGDNDYNGASPQRL